MNRNNSAVNVTAVYKMTVDEIIVHEMPGDQNAG